MILTGKLTFNAVALKMLPIDKIKKDSLILPSGIKGKEEEESLKDYPDHPFQGEVIGVGENVRECKEGDIVLLKIQPNWMPVPIFLNDKGTMYNVYNNTDILLVREKDGTA